MAKLAEDFLGCTCGWTATEHAFAVQHDDLVTYRDHLSVSGQ